LAGADPLKTWSDDDPDMFLEYDREAEENRSYLWLDQDMIKDPDDGDIDFGRNTQDFFAELPPGEAFKVRCIHDREGHTEQVIIEEAEAVKAVEKWLENDDFASALYAEGVYQAGQSHGNRVEVQLDTRAGIIITCTEYPNQYNDADSFFISLVSVNEIEIASEEDFLGDEYTLSLPRHEIETLIDHRYFDELVEEYELKENNGWYQIRFDQAHDEGVDLDDWLEHCMEDPDVYYRAYAVGALEGQGDDWKDQITAFYEDLRNQRDQVLAQEDE
jgi:hypothetical protein